MGYQLNGTLFCFC